MAIFGNKQKTVWIPYEQLVYMVDDIFISEAETESELDKIKYICSVSSFDKMFGTNRKYTSKDGRYDMTIYTSGVGIGNSFGIHDADTNKFFRLDENKNMKKFNKEIESKIAQAKINIYTGKYKSDAKGASKPVQYSVPVMGDLSQLTQLKELLDSGVITQDEFEIKKNQILNLDGSMHQTSPDVETTKPYAEITSDKIAQIKILCMNFVENFKDIKFSTSEKLANVLSIPVNSEIYFMYDHTSIGKDKIGFALTSTGIYLKYVVKEFIITPYEEIRDCHNIYIRDSDIYAGSKKILVPPPGKKYTNAFGSLISEIRDLLQ